MIRLDRVELLNWDLQPHQVLPLAAGVTLLTGENGSGKTSLLDAIKIALGAAVLADKRTADGYLQKQNAPVAMIRLLVDNRPDPATRRRPFDPLGEHRQDTVTLAVVFRGSDEDRHQPDYFILDGDRVPLEAERTDRSVRPLPSAKAYRDRLKKVGIGPQYVRLLALPQGQVAALCRRSGNDLFDELYGIIGGREPLEAWERQLAELRAEQERDRAVEGDLLRAREALDVLSLRVRRYRDFLAKEARAAALAACLPHAERREAREESARRHAEVAAIEAEVARLRRELDGEVARAEAAEATLAGLARQRQALEAAHEAAAGAWKAKVREEALARSERDRLDRLRQAAEGVAARDPEALGREAEALGVRILQGTAAQDERNARSREAARELEAIEQRKERSFPREVEVFRERLRGAGIPHHLLAEVVEVTDPAWAEAAEGYLGRYRFAVLVEDPEAWPRAAAMAREMRYPHGVLAPDVRGQSPADQGSLAAILKVSQPRYRALIARLLRPLTAAEHPVPLQPAERGARLATDGFVVSRLEAWYAPAGRLYLGVEALRRRAADLRRELKALRAEGEAWRAEESALRRARDEVEAGIRHQRDRIAWEAARPDWEALQVRCEALAHEEAAREAERRRIQERLSACDGEIGSVGHVRKSAREAAEVLDGRIARKAEEAGEAARRRDQADDALGVLQAEPLPVLDDAARAVLEELLPVRTMKAELSRLRTDLDGFPADERDPMLPRNLERQEAEVDAVAARLAEQRERLARTREAAEQARDHYQQTTRQVFRHYFAALREAGKGLEFGIEGELAPREDGRFRCQVRVAVNEKAPVHYDSEELSGGQKAALSILMGMTAVSLDAAGGAGFFLIDEPFAASDEAKINELGWFLHRTGAQYLVSMPSSADVQRCQEWLQATWTCTRSLGGYVAPGRPVLAPPVKLAFASTARG